jgi:hypothetical protein
VLRHDCLVPESVTTDCPRRQHAASKVAKQLGLSVVALCRRYGLPRATLYAALAGTGWAVIRTRRLVGDDVADLLAVPRVQP